MTAWRVAPNYTLTRTHIFSNDMLFWGLIMTVVNVGLLLVARRGKRVSTEPLYVHCGYNVTGNVSGICPARGERT